MNIEFKKQLFNSGSNSAFQELALRIFRFQAVNNPVYSEYLNYLDIKTENIKDLYEIPFLPISFFKIHRVVTGEEECAIIFRSSGTTSKISSRHYVTDPELYEESFLRCFKQFYGEPSDYYILALLPSYLEREGSSLIYMMNDLIRRSKHNESGFYLNNWDELLLTIGKIRRKKGKIILVGVTFALLGLAEKHSPDLSGITVIETGGMKGMRKEMVREEVHSFLCKKFNIDSVHSEYGMTELLSQAYSSCCGRFISPPWMKVIVRDPNDPLTNFPADQSTGGGINIIDLANVNSCSFIATDDIGRLHSDNSFEILGRYDNSDIRGCNLLI